METIEKIRESVRSIFEEQDNHPDDIRFWPFILGILFWIFISATIGVFGCVLLSKDGSPYKDVPCSLLIAVILFKPMAKLSIRKKDK